MGLQRRQLEVLVSVRDAGSIHQAAQHLGIAQPAVSRTIGEIERVVGASLFERSAYGCIPTSLGEALVGQARGILRSLERLDAVAGARRGPVRLGCIPRAIPALMPRLLAQQSSLGASALQLKVIEGDSIALLGALQHGELDFAVMRRVEDAGTYPRPLAARPLYAERPVVVASPGHALEHSDRLDLARLHGHGWVLPAAGTTSRRLLDEHCRRQRLAPIEPLVETRSFESSATLLKDTALLALMPELVARQYQRAGRVVVLRLAPPLPRRPVLLVAHRAASDDPMLAILQRQLLAAALQVRGLLAAARRDRYRGRASTSVA